MTPSELKTKLTRRHEIRPNGEQHYVVIGEEGAIHFHLMESSEDSREIFGKRYWGGIEIHSKKQMYDWSEQPTSDNCWILGCQCWSDGSSLMATERYIPEWEFCERTGDFESLWLSLEHMYRNRFKESRDDE